MKSNIGVLFVSALLTGCATGTTITNGREASRVRAPVDPEKVQVYFQYPPIAEEIALIKESANDKGQKATDKTIKRLKERAAKLGANGIVLLDWYQKEGFIMYGPWFIPQDKYTHSAKAVCVP